MRLNRIELKNFMGHAALTLALGRRTLIVGENGAGKSSVKDAIALTLTGRCRGVDGKGQGQRDLVKGGASKAEISIDIEDLGTVTRTIDRLHGADSTMPVDAIMGALRTTEPYVTAAIYGDSFFEVGQAEAKALLMRLLDVKVTLPSAKDGGASKVLSLDEAESRYTLAYSARTSLGRTLKAINVPAEPTAPAWFQVEPDKRTEAAAAIAAAVVSAQQAYEAEARASGDVVSRFADLRRRQDACKVDPDRIVRQRAVADVSRESLVAAKDEQTAARVALAEAEAVPGEAAETLRTQVHELRVFIGRVEPMAAAPKGKAAKTKAADFPSCVLGAGIPCMTPASKFGAVLKQMRADVDALDARLEQNRARTDAVNAAGERLRVATANVDQFQKTLNAAESSVAEMTEKASQKDQIETDIAAISAEEAAGRTRIEAKRKAVQDAINARDEVRDFMVSLQTREGVVSQRAKVQAEYDEADRLVGLLGPKGIQTKALGEALTAFHDMINAHLEPFGFSLRFSVDPWVVEVIHGNSGKPLPYALLSKGQKLWTALAFQVALAKQSGLDFCIVDDVESVVGESRGLLTDLALDADVGQMIIIKAQDSQEQVQDIDGVQVVRMARPVASSVKTIF